MADSPLLFDSSNLPKDHQAARKDAIEKMEAIVSELMKVKDQDAADVVRRAAKDSDRYKLANFIGVAVCNSIPHETRRGPARLRPSPPWSP